MKVIIWGGPLRPDICSGLLSLTCVVGGKEDKVVFDIIANKKLLEFSHEQAVVRLGSCQSVTTIP